MRLGPVNAGPTCLLVSSRLLCESTLPDGGVFYIAVPFSHHRQSQLWTPDPEQHASDCARF